MQSEVTIDMSNTNSCMPCTGNRRLGCVCGTSIDTENVTFSNPKSNLVYMDKVFSYNEAITCPLLLNLNTGGSSAGLFDVSLTLDSQDCCCTPCTLGSGAVFNVENSYVIVDAISTRPPGNINPNQVTINGYPVDSITYQGGQYTAGTTSLIPRVQKPECLEAGLPTKTFMMISGAGPYDFRARYVLEGTVNTNGKTCCFCAVIGNAAAAPPTSLPNDSLSNFAIPNVALPCSKTGIAPDILFQFGAKIKMINPQLSVNCTENTAGQTECTLALAASLVIEPTVHVEVIRRTLFCVTACEGIAACNGVEDAEDEECPDPFAPDCECGCGCGPTPPTNVGETTITVNPGCGCNTGCGGTVLPDNDCGCSTGCNTNCGCDDHCHAPGIQDRKSVV